MKYWFLCVAMSVHLLCYSGEANSDNILSITGEGVVKIHGTLADVSMGIEVSGKSPEQAQEMLAKQQEQVLAALRQSGALKDVETSSFNMYSQYDKDKPNKVIGYTARTSITFTRPAEKAGGLMDTAVQAGANQMQGVSIHASDEELNDARLRAAQLACHNALEEGKATLEHLSLKFKAIRNIDINPQQRPVPYMTKMAVMDNVPSLEVTGQNINVTATARLLLEFE